VTKKSPRILSWQIKCEAGRLCLAEIRRLRRERDRLARGVRQPRDASKHCAGDGGGRRLRRGDALGVSVRDLARMTITFAGHKGEETRQLADVVRLGGSLFGRVIVAFRDGATLRLDPYTSGAAELIEKTSGMLEAAVGASRK